MSHAYSRQEFRSCPTGSSGRPHAPIEMGAFLGAQHSMAGSEAIGPEKAMIPSCGVTPRTNAPLDDRLRQQRNSYDLSQRRELRRSTVEDIRP